MDAVSKGAARLGYSEAMGQMCEHMGAAAPGFTPMALSFHHTADTIGEAAGRGDRAGVLSALDRTLQTCVGCHAMYRQEVVDEETWKKLTAGTTSRWIKVSNRGQRRSLKRRWLPHSLEPAGFLQRSPGPDTPQ